MLGHPRLPMLNRDRLDRVFYVDLLQTLQGGALAQVNQWADPFEHLIEPLHHFVNVPVPYRAVHVVREWRATDNSRPREDTFDFILPLGVRDEELQQVGHAFAVRDDDVT